jgi:hypothetical protein
VPLRHPVFERLCCHAVLASLIGVILSHWTCFHDT